MALKVCILQLLSLFYQQILTLIIILVSGTKINLEKMMKQKDTAVTGLTGGIKHLFKKYNVRGIFLLNIYEN